MPCKRHNTSADHSKTNESKGAHACASFAPLATASGLAHIAATLTLSCGCAAVAITRQCRALNKSAAEADEAQCQIQSTMGAKIKRMFETR